MYLTRIALDTAKKDTMRALISPNLIHGAVENAFNVGRKRRLWRIDVLQGNTYLLVLSDDIPEFSMLQEQFGYIDKPAEIKDYNKFLERIDHGTRWRFRLRANPIKSLTSDDREHRGTVKAITVVPLQKKWLSEQAPKHGFSLSEESFDVISTDWICFQKGTDKKRKVSLVQATYEGVLLVTDREMFIEALRQGIGRGKAYGMGLLTVMKYE